MSANTVVVTVTYGDRADLCLETVRRALGCGASTAVIIDNGSTEASSLRLQDFASQMGSSVDLQREAENLGTAIAFGKGISSAIKHNATHIWILDDDNWPEPNCLAACHTLLQSLDGSTDSAVLACARDTDEHHSLLISGLRSKQVFQPDGTFFGFDILSRLHKQGSESAVYLGSDKQHELPQAPYGGLFGPVEAFLRAGLPRRDFVLYFDDVDYTRRMNDLGIRLYLCPEARIVDADQKWVDSSSNRYLTGMILAKNPVRTYYSYRNCLSLDLARVRKSRSYSRFILNLMVYTLYVTVSSVRLRRLSFLALYARACWDGFTGRMGFQISLQQVSGDD